MYHLFDECHTLVWVRTGLPNKYLQTLQASDAAAEEICHITALSLLADQKHPKNVAVTAYDVDVVNGECCQRAKLAQGPLHQPVSSGPTLLCWSYPYLSIIYFAQMFLSKPLMRQYLDGRDLLGSVLIFPTLILRERQMLGVVSEDEAQTGE